MLAEREFEMGVEGDYEHQFWSWAQLYQWGLKLVTPCPLTNFSIHIIANQFFKKAFNLMVKQCKVNNSGHSWSPAQIPSDPISSRHPPLGSAALPKLCIYDLLQGITFRL